MSNTSKELQMSFLVEENKHDADWDIPFPTTRYQGSKAKITDWIWHNIKHLSFNTVLDAFGGTGTVSHLFKRKGKKVTFNDYLRFNYTIAKALIENNSITLAKEELDFILGKHEEITYPTFIQDTFKDIFYLDEENIFLDQVITNIKHLNNEYKQAIAWFALFQACIIKRPYNLFHRANLYVRTSEVERNFGNKTTWDTSFKEHINKFVSEANKAVFDNGQVCRALNYDVFDMPDSELNYDLVYIDTPYITSKGVGTDYLDFYHFLEGVLDFENWPGKILRNYKHLPLEGKGKNVWTKKKDIHQAFDKLFSKFENSILVVSYRDDGIPTREEIISLLRKYKNNVEEVKSKDYKYALSKTDSKEILFIAT